MKKKKLTKDIKKYFREYYQKNKDKFLERYYNNKKKAPKCALCGKQFPKETQGNIKYCSECLSKRSHGVTAHRLAAVRYYRKKHLTNTREIDTI